MTEEQAAEQQHVVRTEPPKKLYVRPDNLLWHVVAPVLRRTKAEIDDAIGEDVAGLYDGTGMDVTPTIAARLDELCGNAPGLWIELQRAKDFRQGVTFAGDLIQVEDGRQFSFTQVRPTRKNLQERVEEFVASRRDEAVARYRAEQEAKRLKAEEAKQRQEKAERWQEEQRKAKEAEAIKKAEQAKLEAEQTKRRAEAQAIVQARREKFLRQPLPAGLQVLALEFDAACKNDDFWFAAAGPYARVLRTIGNVSCFGQDKHGYGGRMRLDIIARPEILQKWFLKENGRYAFSARQPMGLGVCDVFTLTETEQHRLADSLAYLIEEKGDVERTSFKGGEPFGRCHDAAFDFAQWATAAQATDEELERLATLCNVCNGDASLISSHLERLAAKPKSQSFLVPGLIPNSVITLLLGNRTVGKSSIITELAVAAAQREKTWAGFPIDTSRGGMVFYLFGEDSDDTVTERVELMIGSSVPPLLLQTIRFDGTPLRDTLEYISKRKVAAVLVDPARKFYAGDEDGSDAVSSFFTVLEEFAHRTGCAVVVAHHLKRNAEPRSLADVAKMYRGSSVWLDRPRVVLAMFRTADETHFGIPALSGSPLHNLRAETMFAGVRRLRRDATTHRHIPIDGSMPTPQQADDVAMVQSVLVRLLGQGVKVTRTGKTSNLFALGPAELAGMSRAKVRQAVDDLIASGAIICDAAGALALATNVATGKRRPNGDHGSKKG